ncbi:hypothetical protein [Nannocystis bainbridge]|uniref:RanBP2-type domain-containing protein n=1 Tax=Nannocystis bainbridge TaxID=2995303 RepID=A0ABT5E0R1_9BACT|nr:hypothetical protein [Nannocystis bainbridge]MDC0719452.1 hypothetical protein [Nannocystis bainbridge]
MDTTVTAWGLWDCTRCGQKDISGRDKRCPSCGDPREQHELDAMRPPDDAAFTSAAISDRDELAVAHDGPDWSCHYCGSNNRASSATCDSCGGGRDGRPPPPKPDPTPPPSGLPDRLLASWSTHRRRWIAGLVLLAFAGLVAWCTIDREYPGTVTGLHWQHTTTLERWQNVDRGDWQTAVHERAEVPPRAGHGEVAGVAITGCREKHHHDESYACGTEDYQDSESYTCGSTESCSTQSNGNGSFTRSCTSVPKTCTRSVTRTRTKHCSRPIYATWCDYVTQAWLPARSEVVRGDGHDGLRFAEIATSGDRERTVQDGLYTVVFAYGDEGESYTRTAEKSEYDGWQAGEAVLVSVDHLSGPNNVRRPTDPAP